MKKTVLIPSLCLSFLALAPSALAQAPARIPIQGVLTTNDGSPVEGQRLLRFAIYSAPEGGQPLFRESIELELERGVFSVLLGRTNALDPAIFTRTSTTYLAIAIDGEAEMSPRFELGSVPFALHAAYCEEARTLGGASAEDFATNAHRHDFSDLDQVPPELADGDRDTLSELSCSEGDIAKLGPAGWACSADATIEEGELQDFLNLYEYVQLFQLSSPGFINDPFNPVDWTRIKGMPTNLEDGDDDTTYTAGLGLSLSGTNELSIDDQVTQRRVTACPAGQVIQSVAAAGTPTCLPAGPRRSWIADTLPATNNAPANTAVLLRTIGTFTKQSATSAIYATWDNHVEVGAGPNVFCDFQLRMNDNGPVGNAARIVAYNQTAALERSPGMTHGLWTGLGAGTITVSVWVRGNAPSCGVNFNNFQHGVLIEEQ